MFWTNLFTSQDTPSFFIFLPFPAYLLIFLPLPFFAFSSFTVIRWSRPVSMLPFSAMLMAVAGPAVFFYTRMTLAPDAAMAAIGPMGWPGRRRRTAPIAEGQTSTIRRSFLECVCLPRIIGTNRSTRDRRRRSSGRSSARTALSKPMPMTFRTAIRSVRMMHLLI